MLVSLEGIRAINFSIIDRERKQEAHKLVENCFTKADNSIVEQSGKCTKHTKTGLKTFKTPLHQKVYILVRCPSELQRNLTIMPQYWIAFKDDVEANFLRRHSSGTSNYSVQSFIGCNRGCESESTQKKKTELDLPSRFSYKILGL